MFRETGTSRKNLSSFRKWNFFIFYSYISGSNFLRLKNSHIFQETELLDTSLKNFFFRRTPQGFSSLFFQVFSFVTTIFYHYFSIFFIVHCIFSCNQLRCFFVRYFVFVLFYRECYGFERALFTLFTLHFFATFGTKGFLEAASSSLKVARPTTQVQNTDTAHLFICITQYSAKGISRQVLFIY